MSSEGDEQPLPQDRLQKLASLSDEQFDRLLQLPQQGTISRRQLIGILAGAGLGWGAIQNVLAQASTSDSDGDIGTPSNRVDIFADGIDANSIAQSDLTVSSLTTDALTVNLDLPDGTKEDIINLPATTNGVDSVDGRRYTSAVGTSATSIYSVDANGKTHNLIMVTGSDGSGNRFHELVHFMRLSSGVVDVASTLTQGSPAARSYGADSTNLTLSMGSDTYDVMVRGIENGGF